MARMQLQIANVAVAVAVLVLILGMTNAADPDPLRDFEAGVKSFILRNLLENGQVSVDSGGTRSSTTTDNFPALKMQGLTMARFKLVPCGTNLPHTHPRASEILTLVSGGPLQIGFVDTDGDPHIDTLYPGDVTVFPRGMLHFQLNIGTEEADFIAVLNSENPGFLVQSEAWFKLPEIVVATALNQTLQQVRDINQTMYPYSVSVKKNANSDCVHGCSCCNITPHSEL